MAISNVVFGKTLRPSTVDVMNKINELIAKLNNVETKTLLWEAPSNWDISQGYGITLNDNFTNYDKLEIIPFDKDGFILPEIIIPNPANGMLFTIVDVYMQNPYGHVKAGSYELKNGNTMEYVKGYLNQWMAGEATIYGSGFGYNFQVSPKVIYGIKK